MPYTLRVTSLERFTQPNAPDTALKVSIDSTLTVRIGQEAGVYSWA